MKNDSIILLVDQNDLERVAEKLSIDLEDQPYFSSQVQEWHGSLAVEILQENFCAFMRVEFAGHRRHRDCPTDAELYNAFVESRPVIRSLNELLSRYWLDESGPRLRNLARDEISILPIHCLISPDRARMTISGYSRSIDVDLEENADGMLTVIGGGSVFDLFSYAEDLRVAAGDRYLWDLAVADQLADHGATHQAFDAVIQVDPSNFSELVSVTIKDAKDVD